MSDDDKKGPEADPWANLDAETPGESGDAFSFAFEEEEIDDTAPEKTPESPLSPLETSSLEHAAAEGPQAGATDAAAEAVPAPELDSWDAMVAETIADVAPHREIPLAVFPPPGSETAAGDGDGDVDGDRDGDATTLADAFDSDAPFAAEESGIIAIADVTGGFGGSDAAADDDHQPAGSAQDRFGDARSGGAVEDGSDDAFDDAALAREMALGVAAESADFGDQASESLSDDVSFHAGAVNASSPFGETGTADPFAQADESIREEAASIPMVAGLATAGAAVAGASVRPAAAPKKKGSGIGQLIGIVFGGLLAIPITFAILIWGFQKDPFKFARHVPPQFAFLLPQKLQPGSDKPASKGKRSGPDLSKAKSLDDLAVAGDAVAPADDAAATPAEAAAAAPQQGDGAPADSDGVVVADAATGDAADRGPAMKPAAEPADAAVTVPPPDALAALDPVAPAAVVAPEPPALDLTGVEAAAAKAAEAFDSLASVPDGDDSARRKLLVGWYRQLARLGEELAVLEHTATGTGRPLEDTPAAASGVLERVRGDDAAVGDLVRLGGMWLTSQKRQSDGVVLVATVENVRRVGPYWSTRAQIEDAGDDGATRPVAIISRTQPAVDVGDRMLVSGVLFDGDAVWAVDVRPLAAAQVSAGADGL